MKSENEKKTRRVPTRMTQAQYKIIRQKALDRNMSVSAFVVEAAVHDDKRITPLQIMHLQNLINKAADACESENPTLALELRREGDAQWKIL